MTDIHMLSSTYVYPTKPAQKHTLDGKLSQEHDRRFTNSDFPDQDR